MMRQRAITGAVMAAIGCAVIMWMVIGDTDATRNEKTHAAIHTPAASRARDLLGSNADPEALAALTNALERQRAATIPMDTNEDWTSQRKRLGYLSDEEAMAVIGRDIIAVDVDEILRVLAAEQSRNDALAHWDTNELSKVAGNVNGDRPPRP